MSYAKQIADLQATRKAKADEMKALAEKAAEQGRTFDTGEQEQFDTLKGEVGSIDKNIANLRDLEAMEKADEATAAAVSGDDKKNATVKVNGGGVEVRDTTKLEAKDGLGFARFARVKGIAFKEHADPVNVAKALYPSDEKLVEALTNKAAVPAANTGNAGWAGNLVLDGGAYFADFVEYQRARSVVGQVSDRLRRLPFDTQVLVQTSGGAAKWVAEGASKPLTQWTYTRAKLAQLKVAAIAAATEEQLSRSSIGAETLIRDELVRSVNAAIDGTFVSDAAAVSGESPAGIRQGVTPLVLTGDGTVGGIRCDIKAFIKALLGDNLSTSGAFWVMSESTATDLQFATNEVGNAAFPGIGPSGGTLAGLPVFTSQYAADESEGAVVMLIKGDEIFLGDEGGIQVKASDQASLVMDDAPAANSTTPTAAQVVSMFQTNSVAFLTERFISWQKRRAEAVVWAHVNWDECAS